MTKRGFLPDTAQLKETAVYYRERFPAEALRSIEVADHAVEDRFKVVPSMLGNEYVGLGQPVDWCANPCADPEFIWVLNRHYHFRDLGKAYLLTGNEAYVRTFQEQIRGWRAQNPVPQEPSFEEAVFFQRKGPWRLLETGIRPQTWIFAYSCMKDSPSMEPDFARELAQGLEEHADYLCRYLGDPDINHATMHMQGLFAIGLFLREHVRSIYWRRLAMERLELCLYRQIGGDGVQKELSTHYHNGSVTWFAVPYWWGKLAGYPFKPVYAQVLERMASFTAASIRPDGLSSPFADSDCNDYGLRYLTLLGHVLERPDYVAAGRFTDELLWLAGPQAVELSATATTQNSNLEPAAESLYSYPDAGYRIFRNEEHYLFFDAGPLGGAHGHADALHFEWFRSGRQILVDPGRFTYEEGEWRRYFKGTLAHNTVTVDDADQTLYLTSQHWDEAKAAEVTLHRLFVEGKLLLIDASHDGYMRQAMGVRHRRWLALDTSPGGPLVVVDRLEGEGRHTFCQSFHLHPDWQPSTLEIQPGLWSAEVQDRNADSPHTPDAPKTKTQAGHRFWWAASGDAGTLRVEQEQGWMSVAYGTKEALLVLRAKGSFTESVMLVTVCLPSGGGWQVERIDMQQEPCGVEINLTGAGGAHKRLRLTETETET